MSEPIISVSGLRGIIGDSLTPDLAMRFACAYAAGLPAGKIVITRDGRTTGRMLADAIRSALTAVGKDVVDADIAATPTTGVLLRSFKAVGGIQISASHNPSAYNGLKLFNENGSVLSADAGEKVLQRFRNNVANWSSHDSIGSVETCEDTWTEHLELVTQNVDVERIRKAKFKVVLDSNHGAGSVIGKRLLEELGCDIVQLGGTPDGKFSHPAEPTEANLQSVLADVVSNQAVVGFCQDPDADRLAVIDETGRYIGEEYTLALVLDHVLRQMTGAVVANCATSKMSQDVVENHGSTYHRSAVGEANVVGVMHANNAVFGGEGNGGPIDPRVGYVRDSFVGMAQILDAVAARQEKVSALADELPKYSIQKTTVPLAAENIPAALDALEQKFSNAKVDRTDGLRLDWDDRWLLVRASNTEPIVRAIGEAKTSEAATDLCQQAADIIAEIDSPSGNSLSGQLC
jgi:phosphomannomutase